MKAVPRKSRARMEDYDTRATQARRQRKRLGLRKRFQIPSLALRTGVACLVGFAAVSSRIASGQGESRPSFPTQAEAITVDVVVLDDAGQPVRGLTRDDFTLTEGGRPQSVVAFEARESRETLTETGGALAAAEIRPSNPLPPPPVGARIVLRGALRYDDEHGWYAVDPVEIWIVMAPSPLFPG